tara:strand:+ start:918 stop:2975 length:2058 start_codon:yes stop_codon:yes gene_type:complete
MLKRLKASFNIQLLLIAILCFIAFGNTFKHDFVLDDRSAILENFLVKKGIAGIPEIWQHSYMYGYSRQNDETYRPVPSTLFAITYSAFELNSTPYHLIQILIYTLLCVLVLFYLKRLLREYHPLYPFLITALFCVHPIHTEVVANIKSADEILALLFSIGALHLSLVALDKNKTTLIGLSIVSYFLAVCSKESAITLVVLFPLQFWFFRNYSIRKMALPAAALLLPLAVYFIIRGSLLESMTFVEGSSKLSVYNNSLLGANSISESIGTAFTVLGYYIKLLFLPTNLSYDYSFNAFPIVELHNLKSLISVGIYLLLGALALIGIIRKWGLAFGIILFLAVLSIYSNLFVKIASSGGERFLFAPLLGFLLFVVLGIDQIQKEKTIRWINQSSVSILSIGVIILFTSMTISRNSDWNNEGNLFLIDVEKVPESFRTNLFAANVYEQNAIYASNPTVKSNLYKSALEHLKTAYKIYPEYDETYIQMADIYKQQGDWAKMKKVCKAGLKHHEDNLDLTFMLGDAHMNLNEFSASRKNFLKLISSKDTSQRNSAMFNMGATYLNEQRFDSSIHWFERIKEYRPDDINISYYLAIAYFQVENSDKAVQLFSRIPNDHPTYAHSQSSIGTIYLLEEQYEKAIEHFNLALLVVPGDENILNNMVVAYQALGDFEKAEECIAMINSPNALPGLQ